MATIDTTSIIDRSPLDTTDSALNPPNDDVSLPLDIYSRVPLPMAMLGVALDVLVPSAHAAGRNRIKTETLQGWKDNPAIAPEIQNDETHGLGGNLWRLSFQTKYNLLIALLKWISTEKIALQDQMEVMRIGLRHQQQAAVVQEILVCMPREAVVDDAGRVNHRLFEEILKAGIDLYRTKYLSDNGARSDGAKRSKSPLDGGGYDTRRNFRARFRPNLLEIISRLKAEPRDTPPPTAVTEPARAATVAVTQSPAPTPTTSAKSLPSEAQQIWDRALQLSGPECEASLDEAVLQTLKDEISNGRSKPAVRQAVTIKLQTIVIVCDWCLKNNIPKNVQNALLQIALKFASKYSLVREVFRQLKPSHIHSDTDSDKVDPSKLMQLLQRIKSWYENDYPDTISQAESQRGPFREALATAIEKARQFSPAPQRLQPSGSTWPQQLYDRLVGLSQRSRITELPDASIRVNTDQIIELTIQHETTTRTFRFISQRVMTDFLTRFIDLRIRLAATQRGVPADRALRLTLNIEEGALIEDMSVLDAVERQVEALENSRHDGDDEPPTGASGAISGVSAVLTRSADVPSTLRAIVSAALPELGIAISETASEAWTSLTRWMDSIPPLFQEEGITRNGRMPIPESENFTTLARSNFDTKTATKLVTGAAASNTVESETLAKTAAKTGIPAALLATVNTVMIYNGVDEESRLFYLGSAGIPMLAVGLRTDPVHTVAALLYAIPGTLVGAGAGHVTAEVLPVSEEAKTSIREAAPMLGGAASAGYGLYKTARTLATIAKTCAGVDGAVVAYPLFFVGASTHKFVAEDIPAMVAAHEDNVARKEAYRVENDPFGDGFSANNDQTTDDGGEDGGVTADGDDTVVETAAMVD